MGEIRIVAFTFPPKGWARCDGAILSIAQNQALFSLLGTTYGGNGTTSFALPDLRGRAPVHVGSNFNQGQQAGAEVHTLLVGEMPQHNHAANAGNTAGSAVEDPTGNFWGNLATVAQYKDGTDLTLNPLAVGSTGGGQPHSNMQPYQVLLYIIALQGLFPSRN